MRTRRPEPPEAVLLAEIDSLRAILADSEGRLARRERELKRMIPVEEVHAELDRFNLPRRDGAGRPLFLSQRFALLKVRLEAEG